MSSPATSPEFLKGHGTENDFVLLPDPDDVLDLTPGRVRALCNRRAGLGADGVIRVVPVRDGGAERFFMDYYNADGSVAEMCGNGARLFARYLVEAGWAEPGSIVFRTRGGTRVARLGRVGDVSIEMGPAVVGVHSRALLGDREFAGVAVDVGNPHLVCAGVADESALVALDLTRQPGFDPGVFPDGVNVEFVTALGAEEVSMRVHERGVGETRSCGTGTVAVAAAHLAAAGREAGRVAVRVPGGRVVVDIAADGSTLTGPAVLVARGHLEADFWAAHR
ncbi:diaminopimelate epimerase [Nakamurella sp.]|uniref:diaminopimelate epimerase n=1 Tax=Nakamurella sp. TaxID=1869182 RepID=UPI003B3B1A2D